MNEIYIDFGLNESRVAVIDGGDLAEIYIERQSSERVAGNIYKGRVENVLPGMQAAFVNIGLEKNAFLYVKDVIGYGELIDECTSDEVSINKVLKNGEELLVQVSKEPIGSKGARVTTHITLPGRYLVLMPNVDYIGISRRIEDGVERDRLRGIISELKPENMGLIIRTEAEGKGKADFLEDINFQTKLWNKISAEANRAGTPRLIHKDVDLVYRSIRDLFNRDTNKVIINNKAAHKRAIELIELFAPTQKNHIEYFEAGANIMDFYGISEKIEKALARKVWLKSGGYIVIDQTEALTSIDVNTGKYIGTHNLKDTILSTNAEAAKEIARQLRLRDIGGIIIIDFIDMCSDEHKDLVLEVLKNELKKDRTKSNVFGFTQLGLLEMTRKKMGKRLSAVLQKQCPVCDGNGRILDEESIVMSLERKLVQIFKETDVSTVLVEVNDAVENYLRQGNKSCIKELEESYNRKIILKGLASMAHTDIRIKYLNDEEKIKDAVARFQERDMVEINAVKSKYLNVSDRYSVYNGMVSQIICNENGNVEKVTIDIIP